MRPMRRGKLACALSLGALAGCSASPASSTAPYACLLPFEQRMLVAELFFGRGIAGRAPLTDAEWAEFAAQTIAPNFPDGFTVFDGRGPLAQPATGYAVGERTKILIVAGNARTRSRTADRSCDGCLQDAIPPAIGRHHNPQLMRSVPVIARGIDEAAQPPLLSIKGQNSLCDCNSRSVR